MANQYRQGHILLDPCAIPVSAQRVEPAIAGHVVIAAGETGREHVFKTPRVFIFQEGSNLFIEVTGDEPVYLEHPEHGEIEVDPGCYRLVEQREAEPGAGLAARPSYD